MKSSEENRRRRGHGNLKSRERAKQPTWAEELEIKWENGRGNGFTLPEFQIIFKQKALNKLSSLPMRKAAEGQKRLK